VQAARSRWFVGTGESVAAEIGAFAERYGVDEVMLSPVAGAYDAEPNDAPTGRTQTLELIAAAR
jgi:alkanesulfonate monooxygenase SsuD/methylene tetrahydromethanopterin reductase-like flavin-dependent oxidoreductase (luciferase family)